MSSNIEDLMNKKAQEIKLEENKQIKPKIHYKSFIAGAMLTFIAQPFEVLRTSSVFLNHWGTKPSEILNLSKFIYQKEGVRGFFRGGTIAAVKSSLGFGVFFNGIQNIPYILKTQTKSPEHYIYNQIVNFINGSSAMFFTTMASTPLTVLKTRFEVVGQQEYTSVIQTTKKIYAEEGLRGFYKGIIPTLMRDLPWSGAQYSIYQSLISMYEYFLQKPANENNLFIFLSGALSASASIMIFYPFDNIRVRYQGVRQQNTPLLKLAYHIYQVEGFKGFYRGYLPRLLKKGAQGAIAWTIYEYLKKDQKKKEAIN
ncbi:solute carrier family protein (macronuclear) [Tetrahymena thermophila SB210]|uniref:Solute carrier family protein n=1 Tax=Tetrahymena thermophila (strain SB210) TaxID=312017 RepID=I7LU42_TETTS|nr:solute carrier family protein [Tetrahymena thermophila SB210]EAR89379.1 solute carrier family protein [Tetrahymena thermophila SB210]|eukprot:XP_001009624.1 solute carrier family protein [Tetrahymena thermophila SB210]